MCLGGSQAAPVPEKAPPAPPPPPTLDQEAPKSAAATEGEQVAKKSKGTKSFRAASLTINNTGTKSSNLNIT